ncbi:epidermal growth factor-like protein 7 [Mixophyes fleayi]|uniref:epidermal growth factor-like protein 7 n=1 Tax=Mixophyes fleayi TaxID=3061075 RepID=UPI003F4E35CB
MWGISCMFTGCVLVLGVTSTDHLYHSGRRICSSNVQIGAVSVTQSFIQPVYKPLITLCEGQKVCSTYRTTYKISYRQVSRKTSLPLYTCCPGWRRTESYTHSCHQVSCRLPCQNGGTCVSVNKCDCPPGWTGQHCQTDVDECKTGSHRCSQICNNSAGSFYCGCQEGFHLSENGKLCHKVETPTAAQPPPVQPTVPGPAGVPDAVKEEMQELRDKINAMEQKLQSVLAPFYALSTASPEGGLGPMALLTHSLQQLDRIDSLSEQISFLEERLETCSCKNDV